MPLQIHSSAPDFRFATEVRITDAIGRIVRVFESEFKDIGMHELIWDGRNGSGQKLASGSYMLLIDIAESMETKQVVLLR